VNIGVYTNDIAAGTKVYEPFDPLVDTSNGEADQKDQTGVLLTDQVSWGKWHALLGVRWLSLNQKFMEGKPAYTTYKFNDSDAVPQYGLVYAINPRLSLYASSTGGYRINNSFKDADGNWLPNVTYTQYEGGAKALLLDQQLALTVAIYQLEQKNEAFFAGFNSNGEPYYKAEPGITSKGVEVELSGQPIRGLQVRTTFTYMESKNESDGEPPYQGYAPTQFSLWAQYWLGRNPGHGWWAGGGLTAKDAPVVPSDGGTVPGATLLDLSAGYQQDRWQAIAGVKNVGNVQAFEPIGGGPAWGSDYYYAYRLPGREYRFDLSYRF
jgi:outer membrane receptor for ferric coprogen and ferric-rhodotorulic acid